MQQLASRVALEAHLPPDVVSKMNARNEGIVRAYRERRYSQRAIANHLGLHFTTVSGILRKAPILSSHDPGRKPMSLPTLGRRDANIIDLALLFS